MVKYKNTVRKFKSSTFFVPVPKSVIDTLDLKKGDEVMLDITVFAKPKHYTYRCEDCGHTTSLPDTAVPYCVGCSGSNVVRILGTTHSN